MTNINLGLVREKNDAPWYSITIHDITEVYEECCFFAGDRIDFYSFDHLVKRIALNNQVNVIVSSELEEHWNDCET